MLVEKIWNQNGRQGFLLLIRYKSLAHDDLIAKLFGCSRPHDGDGIKIFDKDDQATKYCSIFAACSKFTSGGLKHPK